LIELIRFSSDLISVPLNDVTVLQFLSENVTKCFIAAAWRPWRHRHHGGLIWSGVVWPATSVDWWQCSLSDGRCRLAVRHTTSWRS